MTSNRTPAVRAKKKPGLGRHLLGLLLVTQPLPGTLVTLSVGVLSFVAATASHNMIEPERLIRMLIGVQCMQAAIGSMNDYHDRVQDRLTRRMKPIPRGLIASWEAPTIATVASAAMIVAAAPLGTVPFLLVTLGEGLGITYDLGLKSTVASGFLYALALPLIPLLAWAVFGRWQPFLPWLFPFGALLGIAMNVANSLPDLEADTVAGVRGLPHLLGFRRGLIVAWAAPVVVLAAMLLLALTGLVPAHAAGMIVAAAGALLSVALAFVLYCLRPQPATLRLTFIVQALGVLALAGGWIAAVAF